MNLQYNSFSTNMVSLSKVSNYVMLSLRWILRQIANGFGLLPTIDVQMMEFGVLDCHRFLFYFFFDNFPESSYP